MSCIGKNRILYLKHLFLVFVSYYLLRFATVPLFIQFICCMLNISRWILVLGSLVLISFQLYEELGSRHFESWMQNLKMQILLRRRLMRIRRKLSRFDFDWTLSFQVSNSLRLNTHLNLFVIKLPTVFKNTCLIIYKFSEFLVYEIAN